MKLEIKVPSVGESITEADIGSWEKTQGDFVNKGDILVILETDKASMEIPAEQNGELSIIRQAGEQVSVGDLIGLIDTSQVKNKIQTSSLTHNSLKESSKQNSTPALEKEEPNLSPSVRRLTESKQLNPSDIKGTGPGGRLTKKDILIVLEQGPTKESSSPSVATSSPLHSKDQTNLKEGQNREAMTRLRKVAAKKLVQSQQSTATLSTFNEVDLSRIIEIRTNYQQDFVKKHGIKLGFMSFFVRAVVAALIEFPRMNAFIEGTDIIYNNHKHIGIAVSTENGLVVPVLFYAETLNLAEIEKKIVEYRDKALALKLTPDDLLGGNFTISNGGVFGSLLSTPILNPPQSGILGMHKIEERPIAKNGKVEIRPMMYLALSYDHRIVDGRESVGFLTKVKESLEEPARLLMSI